MSYFRYSPSRAVVIIMACIVLHNMAVAYRLPDPDDDAHRDNEDDDDDEPCADNQAVGARAVRDSIVRNHFS